MDALMHGCMYARTHVPDPFCEQSLAVVAGWYFSKGYWAGKLPSVVVPFWEQPGREMLPNYDLIQPTTAMPDWNLGPCWAADFAIIYDFCFRRFRRKRNKLGTCMGSMENGVLAMETQISIRCNVVFLFSCPREHNWFTLYPSQSTIGCLVFQDILTLDWAGQYWNIHLQHRFPGRLPITCLYDPQKLCQKSELRASKMAGQAKFLDLIHTWYPHFEIPLLLMKSSPVILC